MGNCTNRISSPGPGVIKAVLWSVAAEPLFLTGLALFLDRLGVLPRKDNAPYGDLMLILFSVLSLGALWASFRFASGGFDPKPPSFVRGQAKPAFAHQIAAVALAAFPGILGFVYFLMFGQAWALFAFCLGGFAASARHALYFGSGQE